MLSPENSPPGSDTGRCQRQGDLEVTGSIGSAVQCHISLGNLAQERNCRHFGSVSMLSERSWVAWSARDGHHPQVPITCRFRPPKCQVPFMYMNASVLKRSGQTQEKNNRKSSPQSSAPIQLARDCLRARGSVSESGTEKGVI